jgi:hypothetical protein
MRRQRRPHTLRTYSSMREFAALKAAARFTMLACTCANAHRHTHPIAARERMAAAHNRNPPKLSRRTPWRVRRRWKRPQPAPPLAAGSKRRPVRTHIATLSQYTIHHKDRMERHLLCRCRRLRTLTCHSALQVSHKHDSNTRLAEPTHWASRCATAAAHCSFNSATSASSDALATAAPLPAASLDNAAVSAPTSDTVDVPAPPRAICSFNVATYATRHKVCQTARPNPRDDRTPPALSLRPPSRVHAPFCATTQWLTQESTSTTLLVTNSTHSAAAAPPCSFSAAISARSASFADPAAACDAATARAACRCAPTHVPIRTHRSQPHMRRQTHLPVLERGTHRHTLRLNPR